MEGQDATLMAAEGSKNRHPHRRMPAKNKPWQKKKPLQKTTSPKTNRKPTHDTNTSQKPTLRSLIYYYYYLHLEKVDQQNHLLVPLSKDITPPELLLQ
jgi:hypothetical protein